VPFTLSTKVNKPNNVQATKTATEVNTSTAASSKTKTSKNTAEKKRIAELYLEKFGNSKKPLSNTASKKLVWAKRLLNIQHEAPTSSKQADKRGKPSDTSFTVISASNPNKKPRIQGLKYSEALKT